MVLLRSGFTCQDNLVYGNTLLTSIILTNHTVFSKDHWGDHIDVECNG